MSPGPRPSLTIQLLIKDNCWQELQFVFSRQNLNRNLQSCWCGDDSSHSQSQSGKRLLLAFRGHPIRSATYQGSCIDPTHQSHTLDLTSEAPILRLFPAIQLLIKDNCWQELHFEFSRQNLNRNVQSPSMWWWLITQPKPIWKKAPPGLQRPSHTESSEPTPWTQPRWSPCPKTSFPSDY